MPRMQKRTLIALTISALGATFLAGCESNILPLQPLQRTEVWVPDAPVAASTQAATEPTTAPTTQTADATPSATTAPTTQLASTAPTTQTASTEAATQPTTQPGHLVVRIIDPNETTRFVYHGDYDNIWKQAMDLLTKTGFEVDRTDYRLGILTTHTLPSAQIVEPWKPQQTNPKNAMENTMHDQVREVRVTISHIPNKPDFYEIGIQVRVSRQTNPAETIGGPIFVEGSGFGRNATVLRSDYAPTTDKDDPSRWVVIGHDPDLEKKLMDELFKRI